MYIPLLDFRRPIMQIRRDTVATVTIMAAPNTYSSLKALLLSPTLAVVSFSIDSVVVVKIRTRVLASVIQKICEEKVLLIHVPYPSVLFFTGMQLNGKS